MSFCTPLATLEEGRLICLVGYRYNSIDDLRGETIGISRIGSGSQVMASVMALNQGWTKDGKVEPIKFESERSWSLLSRFHLLIFRLVP